MEQKYRLIRKHLDELGYPQILVVEALPLVEKLLSDLIHTTENLKDFKNLAENAVKERDCLRIGIEPYKCDNAKLVQECNDLHLAFLQFKEQSERIHKDLNIRFNILEEEHNNCKLKLDAQKQRVRELELESAKKSNKLLDMNTNKRNQGSKVASKPSVSSTGRQSNSNAPNAAMFLADEKISHLNTEIKKLKDERLEQTELLDAYVNQIKSRDIEISRLTSLLEGGRPIQAIQKDCCFGRKNVDIQIAHLTDEVKLLQNENRDLESQLKESIMKQHEAMKRALHLADRNRQLENELRDIDQMALAVEAECNNNLKNNRDKVVKLQHRVEDGTMLIQRLEKEVSNLTREKQVLFTDLETLKLEKQHFENMLESAMTDRKQLTNKINQCTVIENDLNLEIDRLMQQTAMQKRKIVELECFIKSDRYEMPFNGHSKDAPSQDLLHNSSRNRSKSPVRKSEETKEKAGKKVKKHSGASNKQKTSSPTRRTSSPMAIASDSGAFKSSRNFSNDVIQLCMDKLQENFDKEREHFKNDLQDLRRQVEHCRENHGPKLSKDNVCKYPGQESLQRSSRSRTEMDENRKCQYSELTNQNELLNDLKKKLNDNNARMEAYQVEIRDLTREKHDLLNKLESARSRGDWNADSVSNRSTLKRIERERDLAKCDAQRLEEERDMLRERLKNAVDEQLGQQSKMQNEMRSLEDQLHKLELERRQLLHKEDSKSADLGSLEEQCRSSRDQLRQSQAELTQQRAYSSQLKTLQEQTDRALGDAQSNLRKVEEEFRKAKGQIESLERELRAREQEIHSLKKDIGTMRGSLQQIDTERDGLLMTVDDKTERLALLERELKMKESRIKQLEETQADLQQKLSSAMDDHNTREHMIRTTSSESTNLRRELDASMKTNENIRLENRRLQEELALCTRNYKTLSNDYEISKRQIDDLKRQLQQYVAEVKRAEDLMSQKEIERSEMLDHFKSLSHEATVLESNNNDLESEATKCKVQLSVTLDHVAELEDKIHSQDAVIQSYESQMRELTSKVANLEMKIRQENDEKRRIEEDATGLRELCMKLDQQKDNLMQKMNERDDGRSQASRDIERLRQEHDSLRNISEKDRHTVASLENLLAHSRQETVEQRLLNEELLESITKYKKEATVLDKKIKETEQQLDLYQEKALEYCQQVKLLRREIANEKYGNYKADNDYAKSPSLNVEKTQLDVRRSEETSRRANTSENPKPTTVTNANSTAIVAAPKHTQEIAQENLPLIVVNAEPEVRSQTFRKSKTIVTAASSNQKGIDYRNPSLSIEKIQLDVRPETSTRSRTSNASSNLRSVFGANCTKSIVVPPSIRERSNENLYTIVENVRLEVRSQTLGRKPKTSEILTTAVAASSETRVDDKK